MFVLVGVCPWGRTQALVTSGAIEAEAFRAAHGEIVATFSKVQPFLPQIRSASGEPEFCRHMEQVVLGGAEAEEVLARRRKATAAAGAARSAARSAGKPL